MRIFALAALALLAACATATAQPTSTQPPAASSTQSPVAPGLALSSDSSRDAAQSPSGAYTLDSRHVSALWRVRHLGLSLFTARFDTVAGTLNWDGANPSASSVNITIAANSVNTGVLGAQGVRAFDTEIANDVLGAQANPNITFASTAIHTTGPTTGLITGNLTLNGVMRPVVLEASFDGGRLVTFRQKHVLAFSGRTIIKRSDFNASFDNPIVNGTTSDEVEILIQAEFVKT